MYCFVVLQSSNKGNNKLLNSEQSYKGKVKTHKYINSQNHSTTENCENRNDPDFILFCETCLFTCPKSKISISLLQLMDSLHAVHLILHEPNRQKLTLKLHFQGNWFVYEGCP